MDDLIRVGKSMVAMLQQGKFEEAMAEFYADDAVHNEAADAPDGSPFKRVTRGIEDLKKGAAMWNEMNEVHGGENRGPYFFGPDRFAVWMSIDLTPKAGPTAGQRTKMEEVCVYTVKDGKISNVDFMYDFTAMMG